MSLSNSEEFFVQSFSSHGTPNTSNNDSKEYLGSKSIKRRKANKTFKAVHNLTNSKQNLVEFLSPSNADRLKNVIRRFSDSDLLLVQHGSMQRFNLKDENYTKEEVKKIDLKKNDTKKKTEIQKNVVKKNETIKDENDGLQIGEIQKIKPPDPSELPMPPKHWIRA